MIDSRTFIYLSEKSFSYPSKEGRFRPSIRYREYPFEELDLHQENRAYDSVRECFKIAGYDKENYDTPNWNPLGLMIKPGQCVLIKPNLVYDHNNNPNGGMESLCTHPSVIAAVIDYVYIALNEIGKIVIGDSPVQECDFDRLISSSGLDDLVEYYKSKGIDICLKDFRGVRSTVNKGVRCFEEVCTNNDICIDLGEKSEFSELDRNQMDKLRIPNYNPEILKEHHNMQKHEYIISKDVLNADVIINLPKPKTHRKAGVTISLKNMVGICTRKECLPHHTRGTTRNMGDEYDKGGFFKEAESSVTDIINKNAQRGNYYKAQLLRPLRRGLKLFIQKDSVADGCWYKNDTIPKMVVDLNKIIMFCDKQGILKSDVQRKVFTIADMIIAGEGEGPISPENKYTGIIAIGENQVSFDYAITSIMGIDAEKIPTITRARETFAHLGIDFCDNEYVVSNNARWNNINGCDIKRSDGLFFKPAKGWRGYIEKEG